MANRSWTHLFHVCSVFIVCNLTLCLSSLPGVHKRFEYKLSFKGPHLVQRDGTVPFWEHSGHAIASDESIRITPSLRSKKGQVWSKNTNDFEHWEVEVTFRINGRGRVGADGLGIWYTTDKGVEGPVFGSNDRWTGLAVFFDSFDNDNQHNNPYIMAMVNDGTKSYDHNSDGSTQQLGGCLRDYRNKPFPVRVRIEYYQKALTIFIHNGMSTNKDDSELCMRAENVELPKGGRFGVTAATGGLADDHDVSSFLTHSLSPASALGQEVPEEERKKFEAEFEDYYQKLQKAKQDYKEEHPDSAQDEFEEGDRYFESQDVRELKMIFEGQNAIHSTMRNVHQRLDEVVGRQERALSQLGIIQQTQQNLRAGGVPPPPQGQQGLQGSVPQVAYQDTIKRHEVDTVLNTQRELQQAMRDMRALVAEIHSRTASLGGHTGSTGAAAPRGYDGTQHYSDIKNTINILHTDVRTIMNKPQAAVACPPPPATNCVTTFYLIVFFIVQLMVFMGYAMYRSNKEAAAKKFY